MASRRLTTRLFILAVALAVIAILARGLFERQRSAGYREGREIANGYSRSDLADSAEADDAKLSDDEGAAGAMWAKAHGVDRPSECPTYSPAFHRGCTDYVSDQPAP
jgi:hypothetical protein